ncbi:tRNA (N(6)-L-threonylcarbamoyladenosine(37)-C(2))-methylthiotransferase [Haloferax volcanii]|uniref:tRNA-t(6)A37 methylthiotransferase n=2 Tax=Haloferax volcanii TaxID=2246 RepID=A0A558G9D7_HALVO|nr:MULTISPECIES: tRNA (N(6)-L-threonylcarbamoyladenosine(37)-C(2))-methylthiotransferase [Haloferax]ELZ86236.1 MiaB-like tRNA modifying enzyme, archaeal-type [Haloferax alexandrinus JCM 10717]NLV04217.1 tRNA (N(6)-L-threonylcarbamoyladenosine(37)-C(2))-methylthiotransferase [Haloferax alexandrinus]TVT94336.1 tRNA (N(6)-L-threonylcarbamoyladenosine(37)-C(2))-methylthiotransferase [Haloferax volcanii]
MARYHIETYGCTSNRGESRAIESALRDAGHYRVDGPEEADVAIMNTCTVVEKTERNMLRRAKELAAETADLIITGCMALAQGNDFREEGIDAQILHWDDVPTAVTNGECPTPGPGVEPVLDGVVGILPIARGCMSNCSYCITKFATGRVDSPSVEENVEKARALVHAGAKELRITGQDTGVYGWDNGDRKLPELLDRICTEIDGEFRVRVGMANPGGVHGIRDELAAVFARHDKLYNFIHAPVQSGSDEVLEHMRRQHRVDKFREIVETFDRELDYWTLSTDFIVGYPTETDADHERSMELLREVRPEKVNVTRFSKRPGTDAADLKGLGGTLKKERSKEMSEAKMDIVAAAYDEMVGTERDVLVVEEGTGDSVKCRDEAYRQIIVQNATEHGLEPGDFARVTVTAHQTVYAFAEPVEAQPEPREPPAA